MNSFRYVQTTTRTMNSPEKKDWQNVKKYDDNEKMNDNQNFNPGAFLMDYNNMRGSNWRFYKSLRDDLIKYGSLTGISHILICLISYFFFFFLRNCEKKSQNFTNHTPSKKKQKNNAKNVEKQEMSLKKVVSNDRSVKRLKDPTFLFMKYDCDNDFINKVRQGWKGEERAQALLDIKQRFEETPFLTWKQKLYIERIRYDVENDKKFE